MHLFIIGVNPNVYQVKNALAKKIKKSREDATKVLIADKPKINILTKCTSFYFLIKLLPFLKSHHNILFSSGLNEKKEVKRDSNGSQISEICEMMMDNDIRSALGNLNNALEARFNKHSDV